MTLRDVFNKKKFIVTAELSPPKGIDTKPALSIAKQIQGKVDGVNVTDNQRAIMRMNSLSFAHLLKEEGLEPVMQICCRDKNRLALQSEILGAYALGIQNICVMTGDHPTTGDHPHSKPVFDLDSVQLIETIKNLKKGNDLSGKNLDDTPDFYIGGVANPFAEPFALHMIKLKKKIDAGAEFIQTQPFFDIESVEQFMEKVHQLNTKFLIGVAPLKSVKMVDFMNANILSKPVPETIAARLENASDPINEGVKIAGEFINSIKKLAAGVHIMPIGIEASLPGILKLIG